MIEYLLTKANGEIFKMKTDKKKAGQPKNKTQS